VLSEICLLTIKPGQIISRLDAVVNLMANLPVKYQSEIEELILDLLNDPSKLLKRSKQCINESDYDIFYYAFQSHIYHFLIDNCLFLIDPQKQLQVFTALNNRYST